MTGEEEGEEKGEKLKENRLILIRLAVEITENYHANIFVVLEINIAVLESIINITVDCFNAAYLAVVLNGNMTKIWSNSP